MVVQSVVEGEVTTPPFMLRTSENLENKIRISQAAANLIQNGDSITLDVGTTTLEIARHLQNKQDLTVITPSLQIANELINHPGIRLILTGGILRIGELSMVGHLAERIFEDFFVDKLFLGAGAVDIKAGVSEFNIEDALVKRAMVKSAKSVVLVADSSKFNQVAFTSIVPLSDIHTIITDKELDPHLECTNSSKRNRVNFGIKLWRFNDNNYERFIRRRKTGNRDGTYPGASRNSTLQSIRWG